MPSYGIWGLVMAVSVLSDPMDFISSEQIQQMEANETDGFMVLDRHCCHHYVNKTWFFWENLSSSFKYFGKAFFEIPAPPYQTIGDQVHQQFEQYLCRRKTEAFLEVHRWLHKDGWRAAVSTVDFVKSPEGDIAGFLYKSTLLKNKFVDKYMDARNKLGIYEKEASMRLENPEGLTDKEFNDVFMLMMGYNTKEAAFQRGVTQSAICMTLSAARLNLHLDNNQQLLEYAMDNHWYDYLPAMMRKSEGCYLLNDRSSYAV